MACSMARRSSINLVSTRGVTRVQHFSEHIWPILVIIWRNLVGLCISETIMAHLLWADDWVLISDSESGLQKQLDGLSKFYSKNLMIVNELKTKVLVFGTQTKVHIDFNRKTIEQVESWKYLGNIVNTVHSYRGWSAFSYQLQIIWTRTTALISNDKWKKAKFPKP